MPLDFLFSLVHPRTGPVEVLAVHHSVRTLLTTRRDAARTANPASAPRACCGPNPSVTRGSGGWERHPSLVPATSRTPSGRSRRRARRRCGWMRTDAGTSRAAPCGASSGPVAGGVIRPAAFPLGRRPAGRPGAEASEDVAHDPRAPVRVADGRDQDPGAATVDARTPRGTPESGGRAGSGGHGRKNGPEVRVAADTPGDLPGPTVGAADGSGRRHAGKARDVADDRAEAAFADRGGTGGPAAGGAAARGAEAHRTGCGETAGSRTRLGAAARAPGGRADLRPAGTLPPSGSRPRTARADPCRPAPARRHRARGRQARQP